jgi:uncharacterized protein YqgC (DUF456 family)
MTNVVSVNDKKERYMSNSKLCAIIYPITTALWLFSAGIVLYGSMTVGSKLSWNFWTDIAIAVVFGSIAVEKIIAYNKEKKASDKDMVVA